MHIQLDHDLKIHIQIHHSGDKAIDCEYCFQTKEDFEMHIQAFQKEEEL